MGQHGNVDGILGFSRVHLGNRYARVLLVHLGNNKFKRVDFCLVGVGKREILLEIAEVLSQACSIENYHHYYELLLLLLLLLLLQLQLQPVYPFLFIFLISIY